jgi:predicted nucleic acid-binding protein
MTLFDTSVVIDARTITSPWNEWAKQRIAEANETEGAAVNTIVVAEAAVHVKDRERFPSQLEKLGFTLLPLPISAAAPAAKAFELYLERLMQEGKSRSTKIPLGDFFIGAHAEAAAMKLVTRDPDRIKTYFPAVKLIVPAKI